MMMMKMIMKDSCRPKQALFPFDKSELGCEGAEAWPEISQNGTNHHLMPGGVGLEIDTNAQFIKYQIQTQINTKYQDKAPWQKFCQNWTNYPMLLCLDHNAQFLKSSHFLNLFYSREIWVDNRVR